jgi:hypothetical protein
VGLITATIPVGTVVMEETVGMLVIVVLMEVMEVMAPKLTDFAAPMAAQEVLPYLVASLMEEMVENTEMEEIVVWRYLAVLLMDSLVLIVVTEEMVVLQSSPC